MPQVVRIYSFNNDTTFWSICIPPAQPLSPSEKTFNGPTTVNDVCNILSSKLGLPSLNGVELYEQGQGKSKKKGKKALKAVLLNGNLIVEDIISKWNPKNPPKLLLKYPLPPREDETQIPTPTTKPKQKPSNGEVSIEQQSDNDNDNNDEYNQYNEDTQPNTEKDTKMFKEQPHHSPIYPTRKTIQPQQPPQPLYNIRPVTSTTITTPTNQIRVHYLLNPYTFWTINIIQDATTTMILDELAEKLNEGFDSLDLYIFDQSQFGPRFQSEAKLDLDVNVWRLYHRNKDLVKFLVGFKNKPNKENNNNFKPLNSESVQFDPDYFDEKQKTPYKATYTDYPPRYLTPLSPIHSPPLSPSSFKTKNGGLSVTLAKSMFQDSSFFSQESNDQSPPKNKNQLQSEEIKMNWPPPLTQIGYPLQTGNNNNNDNDNYNYIETQLKYHSHSPFSSVSPSQVAEEPSIFSFPQTQLGKMSFEQQWKQMILGNRPKLEVKEKRKSFEKEWRRIMFGEDPFILLSDPEEKKKADDDFLLPQPNYPMSPKEKILSAASHSMSKHEREMDLGSTLLTQKQGVGELQFLNAEKSRTYQDYLMSSDQKLNTLFSSVSTSNYNTSLTPNIFDDIIKSGTEPKEKTSLELKREYYQKLKGGTKELDKLFASVSSYPSK